MFLLGTAWFHWQWFVLFPMKHDRFFVHAHDRQFWVIRTVIDVQNILHPGYKFRILFWRNAPVCFFVRLKFVFLKPDE